MSISEYLSSQGKIFFHVCMLQTVPNQAIFSIQAGVCNLYREFLTSQGFHEVHTPKIISGLIFLASILVSIFYTMFEEMVNSSFHVSVKELRAFFDHFFFLSCQ